jgi:DNA-binding IclR family transcriptional regulator
MGKCMLADLSFGELKLTLGDLHLRRFTPKSIVTEQALVKELEGVRRSGFAVDDEEFEHGLKCVGAPIRDQSGRVKAALSIAGPAARLGRDVMKDRASAVMRVAAELSAVLGYRPREGRENIA